MYYYAQCKLTSTVFIISILGGTVYAKENKRKLQTQSNGVM